MLQLLRSRVTSSSKLSCCSSSFFIFLPTATQAGEKQSSSRSESSASSPSPGCIESGDFWDNRSSSRSSSSSRRPGNCSLLLSPRLLSSLPGPPLTSSCTAQMEREKFLGVFQQLKQEILSEDGFFQHTSDSKAWVEKNLDHNVPGGKLNRGLSVVDSCQLLEGRQLSEEEYFKAASLGWCIEWLQGYFLVMDDIMDKSITRRGQPCWYRMPKVGMIAINDAILLNSHISLILRRHFCASPIYVDLIDLFNEVAFQTASGQMLDLITTPEGEVDLSKYTLSTYLRIVQFKTAYYSFFLPVACALLLTGQATEEKLAASKKILIEMGTYFQVQDDFLDCFGDPAVIGKVGTDIEDTKCSWLVVQALIKANPQQKIIIESQYGKSDPSSVAAIKELYNELKLKEAFEEYEAQTYKEIVAAIDVIPDKPLQEVLLSFLKKIYKRQK